MQGLRWNYISVALALFAVFYIVEALPSHRVKRQEDTNIVDQSDLNPIDSEDSLADGLDREKRKLPESTFAAKNAILGFVFGKIDNAIEAKTRLVNDLDRFNIQKNRQYNIVAPKPINTLQDLINGIVSPKIQELTAQFSHLSGSLLGGGSSGSSSGGGDASAQSGGLGNILSSVFRLSGPILSGSSGGGGAAAGGGAGAGASVGVSVSAS